MQHLAAGQSFDAGKLEDRLALALVMACRRGRGLALLAVAIDRYAAVREGLGDATAEQILTTVRLRLLGSLRDTDALTRTGAETFAILRPDTTGLRDAAATAERVVLAIAEPHRFDGIELRITASVGIAVFPEGGLEARALQQNAERALQRARESGGGTHCLYAPGVPTGPLTRSARADAPHLR